VNWLLKESEEIKKNKPKYNRAQRKSIFNGHYIRKWMRRLFNLKLLKADGRKKEITSFTSLQEGKIVCSELLINYVNKFTYQTKAACFQYKIKSAMAPA
jgi:DNA polymerase-3 subunit epsilon